MRRAVSIAAALLIPAAVLAHSGVKSPEVLARMEAMKEIGDATKVLGRMAKGETEFDAGAANAAAAAIAAKAARSLDLFEPRATDPKSEALPVIWERWDDFAARTEALAIAADQAAPLEDLDGLRAALGRIGKTCKSCHEIYRAPN